MAQLTKDDVIFASFVVNKITKVLVDSFQEALLSTTINWININLSPSEVFSTAKLLFWAEKNGFIKEDEITDLLDPQDAFNEEQLAEWATNNGYKKEE